VRLWGLKPGYSLVGLGDSETKNERGSPVAKLLRQLWNDERGQDIAEYAVMLAVILVIVVGTIRLIGSNANNVFSQVGSTIQ
jgi:Flp pilus assembly pilin Flp